MGLWSHVHEILAGPVLLVWSASTPSMGILTHVYGHMVYGYCQLVPLQQACPYMLWLALSGDTHTCTCDTGQALAVYNAGSP